MRMMTGNWGWPPRTPRDAQAAGSRRRATPTLGFDHLEGRLLLQGDTATIPLFPTSRMVQAGGAIYTIAVSGQGFVKAHPIGHGQIGVNLFGTTAASTVTVALTKANPRFTNSHLPIGKLVVRSGQLGAFEAEGAADLNGRMSPLRGSVNQLRFNSLGPDAQIDVQGNLGSLFVTQGVNLGTNGRVHVSGDVGGSVTVGDDLVLNGGQVIFDRDLTESIVVGGNLAASNGGVLVVGRDLLGSVAVGGDLSLASGGTILVGRDLATLSVNGDLTTAAGGAVRIGGNLGMLTITGSFRGKESGDLFVGLNLGMLQVLGGGFNQSGVDRVDVEVGKNIQGLDVPHGIFNSFITAGVLIDGGRTPGDTGAGNVGPDGPTAIFNTEIRAGVQIRNLVLAGDVASDHVRNPSSRQTRIVAGEDRQGNFTAGGNIDNFQITGALIDSVVAASVNPDGDGTYDAPGGVIQVGTFGNPVTLKNFTAPPYDRGLDSILDDVVLPGAINSRFAPPLQTATPTPTALIPLPTLSTVLGGVISTLHGSESDFAGFFAADTRGVLTGVKPQFTGSA
jgi:hypothetical protein